MYSLSIDLSLAANLKIKFNPVRKICICSSLLLNMFVNKVCSPLFTWVFNFPYPNSISKSDKRYSSTLVIEARKFSLYFRFIFLFICLGLSSNFFTIVLILFLITETWSLSQKLCAKDNSSFVDHSLSISRKNDLYEREILFWW